MANKNLENFEKELFALMGRYEVELVILGEDSGPCWQNGTGLGAKNGKDEIRLFYGYDFKLEI
jgi:hypothetical protein